MAPVIGTAGWAIAAVDRPRFPAEGSSLQRYASVLNGVEVNSSFHRPHRRTTWERWAREVPDSFRFAAKIPKEISHVRRLVDVDAVLDKFLEEAGELGDKLAILLLQLPPTLEFDGDVAGAFLRAASSRTKATIVCEPRHGSWFSPQADDLLAGLGIARVAADPARVPQAAQPGGWRGLSYFRLHGSPVMYRSAYGEERLRRYAELITSEVSAGTPVWCMFDNTASSAALGDALLLSKQLAKIPAGP